MLCILQSRMSSRRLPGKMMMDFNGRPLLGRVLDRLSASIKISKIVIATSVDESDDKIEEFSKREGFFCYRGSLNDVAGRFLGAATQENAPAFVRINGDSPFIDPRIVDFAICLFELGNADLVTNVLTRTFPKGQSVEVLLTETFAKSYNKLCDSLQREHVTKLYYDEPGEYRITSFTSGGDFSNVNMCVDTDEDKRAVVNALEKVNNAPQDWKSLIPLFQELK